MSEHERDADRFEVVEAMARAADQLGWRLEHVDSQDWLIRISVVPPLARSRPERNRWPHEPEEREEQHTQLGDWDTNPNPPLLHVREEGGGGGA